MNRMKLLAALLIVLVGILCAAALVPAHGVAVLEYHMVNDEDPDNYVVSPAEFTAQLSYLQQAGYHSISVSEMMDGLEGRRTLPDKPVVITFDDGYADNYTIALPILQQFGMKGNVFIIAAAVGEPYFLDWQQIRGLAAAGVEIGSHTVNHTDLKAADEAARYNELAQSRALLEAGLGSRIEFIAYPFGQYDQDLFAALAATGYRGAFTGHPGLNNGRENKYALKRINIPKPRFGMLEFRLRLLRANLCANLHL